MQVPEGRPEKVERHPAHPATCEIVADAVPAAIARGGSP